MGDEFSDIEPARENEAGDFALQGDVRRIAANEVFFIDADFREVNERFCAAFGMSEKKDLARAADLVKRLAHGRVGRGGYYCGID